MAHSFELQQRRHGCAGHEACNRTEVARAARRFPLVLELLAAGSVNPTTVCLRSPHLSCMRSLLRSEAIVRRAKHARPSTSRGQVFAFKLGINPRTLERWEQGRSKPNEQAAALIWLVRRFPDTLDRLESLARSA